MSQISNETVEHLYDLAENVRIKLNLSYDGESVKYIEQFIEKYKVDFSQEERTGVIKSLGSFLGQCIIENYGGTWQEDQQQQTICLKMTGDGKVFPFTKVIKQFDNGLEDSVYSLFMAIPAIFKTVE